MNDLDRTLLSAVVAAGEGGATADSVCRPWVGVAEAASFARLLELRLVRLERRDSTFVYVATPTGVDQSHPLAAG
jgi:hypothetical protein